ncbi:thiamine-phosphate kinase [Marinobacter mangrovi]|uniref:thiamine-phosphate kinase n=1 Tax=Marinobacter mangrovi TaxID=2803918 RepID=UPI001932B97B|nr:thiamine-phosphate kinase [Marinobacter mangrovi]
MGEFELIRQYFQPVAQRTLHPDVELGIGDDCAIQRIEPGQVLVFSMDTLVDGIHFPSGYAPDRLARRALAVAASDLAAMGAEPVCFTLGLTLPEANPDWLDPFAAALAQAAEDFGLSLAGGDTTRGPLTLTLQVHGSVPDGQALLRSGARPGDLVAVSGTLGDAAAALGYLNESAPGEQQQALLQKYHQPEPRLDLGWALRGRASAAIDISDGLMADLGHILQASGCGAVIDAARIPLSPALNALAGERAISHALRGGDDYELCFTLPARHWDAVKQKSPVPVQVIGEIVAEPGLTLTNADQDASPLRSGYEHFGVAND